MMDEFTVTFIVDGIPLDRLPIRVGPAEVVWSKFPPTDHKGQRYLQRRAGADFKQTWFTDGFAAVDMTVEASSHSDAVTKGFDGASVVADLLALRLGISDATFDLGSEPAPKVAPAVLVKRRSEDQARVFSYYREILGYVDTDGEVAAQRRAFDTGAFPKLLERVPAELFNDRDNEIHLRLRRALHWWAESRATQVLASSFLLSWTALESLSGCPEDNWKIKGKLIKERLAGLASKHGYSVPERRLGDLWHLRRELVHEAVAGYFDAQAGHARQIAGLMWDTRYLLILAVILALDSCQTKRSLLAMWSSLPDYVPSMVVREQEVPAQLLFAEWMGGQEPDMARPDE